MSNDIEINNLVLISSSGKLSIKQWHLQPQQHWAIFAAHSHCVSSLVQLFSGERLPDQGEILHRPERVACVSLSMQQQLLEQELAKDDTDFLDRIDYGSSVEQLVLDAGCPAAQLENLLADCDLLSLRQRPFRQLSTGESRRLMLARALAQQPQMLILDEPYSGLDVAHRQSLSQLLERLSATIQLVVITSRDDELPACISHVALFDQHSLAQTLSRQQWHQHPVMQQLQALSEQKSHAMLALLEQYHTDQQWPDPLLQLNQVKVEYTDGLIFEQVDWQVRVGQQWQIRGPNGCGKSTLLGLIMGDHPQCYCNDIQVLGMKRGSGETIWDIKQRIGIVSSALHLQYRVGCSALEVILSGFFDSIGLYEQPSQRQIAQAKAWLAVLEMSELAKVSFRSLDYGQQRLLLIARALIKQPALLILDEPYQGLDYLSRKLVFAVLENIAQSGLSQLLYVTHHQEDSLSAIDHFVDFVPAERGYWVEISQS